MVEIVLAIVADLTKVGSVGNHTAHAWLTMGQARGDYLFVWILPCITF
jgi:hypothetical protein